MPRQRQHRELTEASLSLAKCSDQPSCPLTEETDSPLRCFSFSSAMCCSRVRVSWSSCQGVPAASTVQSIGGATETRSMPHTSPCSSVCIGHSSQQQSRQQTIEVRSEGFQKVYGA